MELSEDKSESSDRKELSASSGPRPASTFTQSPTAMKTTSLEQVQATPELSFSSVWNHLVAHKIMLCRLCKEDKQQNSQVCLSCVIQLEEEEAKDSFDVDVAVTNPEKVGQSLFYFILSVY